nr:receptor-like protein EIX2 [Ziziphus jujuba var. spinosa]
MRSDDIYFVGSSTLALTNGSFKIMAKANKSHRTANFEFISKSFDREDSSNIGKIPTANQFLTFDDPSIYQGNVGLCGKPLDNDCLGSSQFGTPRGEKEDKDGDLGDKTEKVGFYISIALGFIVGFWGVFGSLIINKSWRYTYFGFVQRPSNLHILDLSYNTLSGHIPYCIGNLSGMISELANSDTALVNGSFNRVAKGRMMEYLYSTISIVNSLYLSNNNLSGEIPTSNQFQTLKTHQSIKAMLASWKLLKTDCIVDAPPGEKAEEDDDVGDPIIEQLGFVISTILSFFVGLWGVWRTLIIRRSWRDA